MLQPVGIMVVNGIRNVFLCQSFQSLLDEIGLGSEQHGNNFFTDRHRAAAGCLLTGVTPLLFTQYKSTWLVTIRLCRLVGIRLNL